MSVDVDDAVRRTRICRVSARCVLGAPMARPTCDRGPSAPMMTRGSIWRPSASLAPLRRRRARHRTGRGRSSCRRSSDGGAARHPPRTSSSRGRADAVPRRRCPRPRPSATARTRHIGPGGRGTSGARRRRRVPRGARRLVPRWLRQGRARPRGHRPSAAHPPEVPSGGGQASRTAAERCVLPSR